jgi:adenosylcobinamide-GDP ribazoletransferase
MRESVGATTDGLRLAVTTLSITPAPPPRTVDRRRAGVAMVAAPLVGLALGVAAACGVYLARQVLGLGHGGHGFGGDPTLVPAVIGISLLALLTRGLHLDGLADTADGLGSMKPAQQARAVMRSGDVGPLGVVSIVLVLLVQVSALAQAIADHHGTAAMLVACLASRCCLTVACRTGVVAAEETGLGAMVAQSVRRWVAAFTVAGCVGLAALVAQADVHTDDRRFETGQAMAAVLVAVLLTEILRRHCSRRLGGLTGDVLGFIVEVGMGSALLVMAVIPPTS